MPQREGRRHVERSEVRVMPQRAFPDNGRFFPPFEIVVDHNAQNDHLREVAELRRQLFEFGPGVFPHFQ